MSCAITPGQIRLIYKLLRDTHLEADKSSIVSSYTNNRTISIREMSVDEAKMLINGLNKNAPQKGDRKTETPSVKKMKNNILSMAHELGWEKDKKVDMKSVNAWCETRGYLKKKLDEHSHTELPKLVHQFTQMFKNQIAKRPKNQ